MPVVGEQVVRFHAAALDLHELQRCQAILNALPVNGQDLVVDEVLWSMPYMYVYIHIAS